MNFISFSFFKKKEKETKQRKRKKVFMLWFDHRDMVEVKTDSDLLTEALFQQNGDFVRVILSERSE